MVKRMNLVSLKPPGHFLVLKAYSVAEMISRNGKKSPVMKLVSTPDVSPYNIAMAMLS